MYKPIGSPLRSTDQLPSRPRQIHLSHCACQPPIVQRSLHDCSISTVAGFVHLDIKLVGDTRPFLYLGRSRVRIPNRGHTYYVLLETFALGSATEYPRSAFASSSREHLDVSDFWKAPTNETYEGISLKPRENG